MLPLKKKHICRESGTSLGLGLPGLCTLKMMDQCKHEGCCCSYPGRCKLLKSAAAILIDLHRDVPKGIYTANRWRKLPPNKEKHKNNTNTTTKHQTSKTSTPPKFNSLPLKNDGKTFLFSGSKQRGHHITNPNNALL